LTPGLNFINILSTAFTQADPESVKFQLSRQYLFVLLGCGRIKAARRTLMKLTPDHPVTSTTSAAFVVVAADDFVVGLVIHPDFAEDRRILSPDVQCCRITWKKNERNHVSACLLKYLVSCSVI
jgi:hypothetical protein